MNHDQLTLPFLDTTSLGGGFGLYGEFPTAKSPAGAPMNFEAAEPKVLGTLLPTEPSIAAQDWRGCRCVAADAPNLVGRRSGFMGADGYKC
jgi:hypothetical protein